MERIWLGKRRYARLPAVARYDKNRLFLRSFGMKKRGLLQLRRKIECENLIFRAFDYAAAKTVNAVV